MIQAGAFSGLAVRVIRANLAWTGLKTITDQSQGVFGREAEHPILRDHPVSRVQVVEGSFDTDTLSSGQRTALDALVVAAAKRWRIPAERIAGHRDYARTRCPGRNLYAELGRLREGVAKQD
jgi:hypothetical protein